MTSLIVTTNPFAPLNLTPKSVHSLNTQPRAKIGRDDFTGARLVIRDSSVRFQFGSIRQPSTISQIDRLTGANIVNRFSSNPQIQFGSNLQIADFNGDGLDDLAVTAPRSGESGQTFIYLGSTNGLVFNQVLDGTAPGVNNVIGSGDFNGDGLEDLAFADPDSGLSGQVTISFGNTNGLSTTQILVP